MNASHVGKVVLLVLLSKCVLLAGCRGVAPATINDWTYVPLVEVFKDGALIRLDGKPAPAFLQGVSNYINPAYLNAAGTHTIVQTGAPKNRFNIIKVQVFNLDGTLLVEQSDPRGDYPTEAVASFVGANWVVVGRELDAVVWSLGPESATRVISLREAFPEAKYVNDSVAVSPHGDIAAGVDRSTLVIRTREGESHSVPGVGSPYLMAWSGDGTFLVVTNNDDRTFVVGRDGQILAKWRRYILVWHGFGERSFVCSESGRFFVAEVNADYSWSQRSSLAWDASNCPAVSPDGSVVFLGDAIWGYDVYKRTGGGGYQRVAAPTGKIIGNVRAEVGEARKER